MICCRLKKLLILLTSQSCVECTQTTAGEELHLSSSLFCCFFLLLAAQTGWISQFLRYICYCATNCTE